ncbi:MAG: response regulator transcription factor [Candidatus Delongbacteria bacterium]|nr:response regulator transcription factor [Candidatus Delongbacteria bacterium]
MQYAMNDNFKILIVEDEEDISEIVKINLELENFIVDTIPSAEKALEIDLNSYDLFLFDVMLENMTGLELAGKIKEIEFLKNIPVIFLTAKNKEDNILEGFDLGADDYITKPFSIKELIARVKAVLKRIYPEGKISTGTIEIDELRKVAVTSDFEIPLTRKEYLLLRTLINNRRILFSREHLLDIVWDDQGEVTDRAVDVMIRRLRKKLGNAGLSIKTRSGMGYTYDP